MAIKEFEIGPQNYFEEDYFSGDYTQSNVSRAFLECDIDNIKGGRVVTGLYFEDNYIDGTTFHDNTIRATLEVEAMIVQEAEVSLGSYMSEGYYEADYFQQQGSFFTLTAELERFGLVVEATALLESQFTQTVDSNKLLSVAADLNAVAEQTTINLRIVQAQCEFEALFEPNFAVNAVVNTFAVLDSTAALATVATANRSADVALASIINLSLQGDRIRGYVVSATSTFTSQIQLSKLENLSADLTAEFTLQEFSVNFRPAQAQLQSTFTKIVDIKKIAGFSANISSQAQQQTTAEKTVDSLINADSAFSLSSNVEIISPRDLFVTALDADVYFFPQSGQSGAFFSGEKSVCTDDLGNVYTVGNEIYDRQTVITNPVDPPGSGDAYTLLYFRTLIVKRSPRGQILFQRQLEDTTQYQDDRKINSRIVYDQGSLYVVTTNTFKIESDNFAPGAENIKIYKYDIATDSVLWSRNYRGTLSRRTFNLCDIKFYNNQLQILIDNQDLGSTILKYSSEGLFLGVSGSDNSGASVFVIPQDHSRFDIKDNFAYIPQMLTFSSSFEGYLAKVALSGTTGNVVRRFPNFEVSTVRLDADNNIYMCGRHIIGSGSSAVQSLAFVKLDSNFNVLWAKNNYGLQNSTALFELNQEGNIVAVRHTHSSLVGVPPGTVVRPSIMVIDKNTGNVIANKQVTLQDYPNNTAIPRIVRSISCSNGWLQVSGTFLPPTGVENFPNPRENEFVTLQIQDNLSEANFTANGINIQDLPIPTVTNISLSVLNVTYNNTATGSITTAFPISPQFAEVTRPKGTIYFVRLTTVSTLSSTVTIDARYDRLLQDSVTANAVFSADINVEKITRFTAALGSAFNATGSGVRIKPLTASLTAESNLTLDPLRIQQLSAELNSEFSVTAIDEYVKAGEFDLVVAATLTADPYDFAKAEATLVSQSTLDCDLLRIRTTDAELPSVATKVTASIRRRSDVADLDAVSSINIDAEKVSVFNIDANTEFTQTATAVKTTNSGADLVATTLLTADEDKIAGNNATLISEFAQQLDYIRFRSTGLAVDSTAELTAITVSTTRTEAQLDTESTLAVVLDRIRTTGSDLALEFTDTITAVKTVDPVIEFTSMATKLVVGNVIAFDRELTLTVTREFRTLSLHEEPLILMVEPETRVNMVRKTL